MGIALSRTLTDEPDLLNRVISSLESAVLDEIVGRLERNECSQRDMSHEQGVEGEASGGRRCTRLGTPGRRSAYYCKSWRSSAAAVTRPKSEFSLTKLPLSADVLSSFLAVSGSHWKINCLTRRASDQARCIVRAGGLRERDAGCPRLVRKFRLVIPWASFGKVWCPVGAAERHPARNAGLSRQSGWCSPVMEANKCPTRHRHDSAKKRRGTPG